MRWAVKSDFLIFWASRMLGARAPHPAPTQPGRQRKTGRSTIDLQLTEFTALPYLPTGLWRVVVFSGRQLTHNMSKTPPSPSKRPRNKTRLLMDTGYSSRSRSTSSQIPEERPNRLDQPSPSPSLRKVCLCVGRGCSRDSAAMIAPPRCKGGADTSLQEICACGERFSYSCSGASQAHQQVSPSLVRCLTTSCREQKQESSTTKN